MSGNGRWALQNGVSRDEGQDRGIERSLDIIGASLKMGIETLSLYTFYSENWQRTKTGSFKVPRMLENYLANGLKPFVDKGVRVRVIGSREGFSQATNTLIRNIERTSANNSAMVLNLALDYGGKSEIVRAVNHVIEESAEPLKMTEELIEKNLDTAGLPPVDLIIRAGGEKKVSNFLIWQAVYAELYFSNALWPDFDRNHYQEAIDDYTSRKERYE